MDDKLIRSIQGKFSGKDKFQSFKDYITDIHFPYYKGLIKDASIEFKFPLTVLVGENGCGKSSVLQALENVAAGKSLSQRWFSTSVDPISDGERPCFWYSYYSAEAKNIVQVLNTRIKKKLKDGSENPDYWEPSRPIAKYGMKLFDEKFANTPGATGSRWNGTKRKIEYIDFREEISAFDKFFYFGITRTKTKQEYIRLRSKNLKKVIDGVIDGKLKNDLRSVVELLPKEVSILSDILDKQYRSVKIIEHKFYSKWGTSVYFSQKSYDDSFSGKYSEAFAGSGESAVAKLVHKIFNAQNGTLLLLDEPEVSLHPGAQKRLMKFILENVRDKGLQVVISTHSPAIVEELPPEAIVVMYQNPENKFVPHPNIPANIAFQYIGHTNVEKKKIIVEDEVAKILVEQALSFVDEKALASVDVVCHPGGAKDIYKEAVVLSRLNSEKTFLFLDGDQEKEISLSSSIAEDELDDVLFKITGIKVSKLGFVSDSGKEKNHLLDEKKRYLDFLNRHCCFLPLKTPEEILWKCSDKSPHTKVNEELKDSYKRAIVEWANESFGGKLQASDICTYQRMLCNAISRNNPEMVELRKKLKKIVW